MSDCREFEQQLLGRLAGDAGEIPASLLRHSRECPSCRAFLEVEERLRAKKEPEIRLADSDLAEMRARVRREVAPERWQRPPSKGAPLQLLAATLVGALLLTAGYAWGRHSRGAGPALDPDRLVRHLDLRAVGHQSLKQLEAEPYTVANVRVRESEGGRVRLAFDVATHLEVERSPGDPLVTDLLIQSLTGASSLGTRLKSISLTQGSAEPRVRDALIRATHGDPSPAVRMKALETLVEEGLGAQIETVLLTVLESEPSVGMRLFALDQLTRHGVVPAELARALRSGEPEGVAPLWRRAGDYLQRSEVEG